MNTVNQSQVVTSEISKGDVVSVQVEPSGLIVYRLVSVISIGINSYKYKNQSDSHWHSLENVSTHYKKQVHDHNR